MGSRAKGNVKGRTKDRVRKPIADPTLEGNDGNKTGRALKKIGPHDWGVLLNSISREKTVVEHETDSSIFRQGQPADAIFYLRRGKVKLTVMSPLGKEALVAVLGAGEFFGEGCLAGQRYRMATAVAMADCILDKVEKPAMARMLHEMHDISELFVKQLLARNVRYEADLIDQLFNSTEKRLARILLLLAHFGKERRSDRVAPSVSQNALSEMIGITRSQVRGFMNRFKRLGFIDYNGHGLIVNSSLLNVVLHD